MKTKITLFTVILTVGLATACSFGGLTSSTPVINISVQATENEPAATLPLIQLPSTNTPHNTPSVITAFKDQSTQAGPYIIVDTGQGLCYDDNEVISCPEVGDPYYGQDAQYTSAQPEYVDNGDGTITDINTGLMWQKDLEAKKTYTDAVAGAKTLTLAGYSDWRLPTIKELYSLILFNGTDVSPCMGDRACTGIPFIDTNYFDFKYGDANAGERVIDAQYWSGTEYVGTTMNGNATVFGVNFADGRIKGYPRDHGPRGEPFTEYTRYVRGNPNYGINKFVDNGNGTITDEATHLMWMQSDSSKGLNWNDALNYCEGLNVAGYDDWRLPDAKELQSIVDYTQAPTITNSAAIDPLLNVTSITDEGGKPNYPFYWSNTTHAASNGGGNAGVYIAFGEALGFMKLGQNSNNAQLMDVHGAGAQRSDPKNGDAGQWSQGHGPQGDVVRIYNFARCVRAGSVNSTPGGNPDTSRTGVSIESVVGQPGQGQAPSAGGLSMPGLQSPSGETPPQAAIDACTGSAQGNTCQIDTPKGNLAGSCMFIQNQLACVPVGGPPGNQP